MNKKIVALVVGLGLTVTLAACQGGDKPAGDGGSMKPSETPKTSAPPASPAAPAKTPAPTATPKSP